MAAISTSHQLPQQISVHGQLQPLVCSDDSGRDQAAAYSVLTDAQKKQRLEENLELDFFFSLWLKGMASFRATFQFRALGGRASTASFLSRIKRSSSESAAIVSRVR